MTVTDLKDLLKQDGVEAPLNNSLVVSDKADSQAAGSIRVLVCGQPAVTNPFIQELGPGNPTGVHVLSQARDLQLDLLQDIQEYKPHVVLVSPDARNYSVEGLQQLINYPEFPIAVVGLVPPTGAWGSEMLAAGTVAFYHTPVGPGVVQQFAREARGIVEKAKTAWRAPAVNSGVERNILDAVGATAYRTGVVTFWSDKGGVGKTSMSLETAMALSQVGGKRVLLVDANMNGGNVALRLELKEKAGKNNIAHLASDYYNNSNQINSRMITARATKVDAQLDKQTKQVVNRLDILLGIPSAKLATSNTLKGQQGEKFIIDLLRQAREMYEFVIVDCGSSIASGLHMGTLMAADIVLFVTNDDIAAIDGNRETLEVLFSESQFNRDKFRLIVNQYDSRSNIDLKNIAMYLRMPVFATVPEDTSRTFRNCGNDQRSFVLTHLNIRKNSPEVEATMRGIFAIGEGIFPPMAAIIQARNDQLDGKKKNPIFDWGKKK